MLDKFFPLYIAVFLISLVITAVTEKKIIPSLKVKAQQPIYTDGPGWHVKKSGTPTMGGIAFLIAISVSIIFAVLFLLFKRESTNEILALLICQAYAVLNSIVGIIDDGKKLKRNNNKGLSATQKLLVQLVLAIGFLVARYYLLNDTGDISFSFGTVNLGFWYYPISLIILVGIVNCANLTDGIDGLASSVAFSVGVSLLYISAALNTSSSVIASSVIGAAVGFLIFNLHPAKIFMGDTGSLYFGSLIASVAFVLGNPLIIIFIAGVYVLEGCSVIVQVLWYKLTGKRIFKMAPIHHHLEKLGFSENRICIIAIILTFIFSIPAYIFYLP